MVLRARPLAPPALALLLAVLVALAAAGPAPARADVTLTRPDSPTAPPRGYERDARAVVRLADATEEVRAEREVHARLRGTALTEGPGGRWRVSYRAPGGGEERVRVVVDDASGRVLEAWRGAQVAWPMARGYDGAFGRSVSAPWIWLPLCVLFLAPFVDPRRPLRLLHLDLLVLLLFGASHAFFNRGEIEWSVPLAYPVLLYVLGRMLWVGLRPRAGRGPLVPLAPPGLLLLGIVFLVGFRVALNVADSNVIDVGYAGVIGADRVTGPGELYDGSFPEDNPHGDTYGPVNYLLYVPWELLFPLRGGAAGSLPGAHAAALAFDLGTLALLVLLGRRLRPGEEGRRLGLALGYAWASYPYALYVLASNANDSLVALGVVAALLALESPARRGAALALVAAAKFAPLLLVPLWATGRGPARGRAWLPFALAFVVAWALVWVPFLPAGGIEQVWERTLWSQLDRESPFSVWGRWPELRAVQIAVEAATVAGALALAWRPRERTPGQVAALGAALLVALQIATTHWFYLYVVWWAPLTFVALFALHSTDPAREEREAAPAQAREPVAA